MKKAILSLIIIALVLLTACTPNQEVEDVEDDIPDVQLPKTLKEAVTMYHDKLSMILEDDDDTLGQNNQLIRYYNPTPFDPDDMIERDTYLDIYNKQKDNSNEVNLTEYLSSYKFLLDEIMVILEEANIDEMNIDMQIDFLYYQSLSASVYLSRDSGVVIKFMASAIFSEQLIYYGIKMGYEDNVFFVKELANYKSNDTYSYFEFLENISLIKIKYRDEENFRYEYVNQVDNEMFEVYRSSNDYAPDESLLRWFNPDTNIRTVYSDGGYEPIKHFELFNDKTSVFDYTDYLNGDLTI